MSSSRLHGRQATTLLLRGAHVHTLDGRAGRSLALGGDRVLAAGGDAGALDALATEDTLVVEAGGLCLVPGLGDAHVHQIEAGQDLDTVDLTAARTLADLTGALQAAVDASDGAWVVSRRGWQESRLLERRLPTRAELDAVSSEHPIVVRRGSHLAVLNSAALRLAGALPVEPDGAGEPGVVRGMGAITSLLTGDRHRPVPDRAETLARICRWHARRGLTGARDAGVAPEELAAYDDLAAQGGLTVRTDVMVAVPRDLDQAGKLALLDDLGPPPRPRGAFLRVGGVKLFVDGHVADACLRGGKPGRTTGTLHLGTADLREVTERAVALGWRVGSHAVGDGALDVVLDAYEAVLRQHPDLPLGWLAVEHACLADDAQRRRAAALGVGVTLQHPLLYTYGGAMLEHWGARRTATCSPARSWLRAGALVAAGSDGHVVPFDPMLSLWGLVTRGTLDAGVQGRGESVSLETALRLYSTAGRWLSPWRVPARAFGVGALADLVGFSQCLFEADIDELAGGFGPSLTVVAGQAVHDPDNLWPTPPDSSGS